jgi:hypothetical protein
VASVSIQDLGSIGELIAAIATIATLIYLATQVRQNTRALKSATFQNISGEMSKNLEPMINSAEVAAILVNGTNDPASLSAEERLRYSSILVVSFRRLESIYVQHTLGSIDKELKEGFEISIMALLQTPFGKQWWKTAKLAFYEPFTNHVDRRLASGEIPLIHPSVIIQAEESEIKK